MEVLMLAGGMGTRLRKVVSDVPKPMAPIGNTPFMEYLLRWVSGYNVTSIVLSVGYKAEVISSYFGDNFNNIPLLYALESEPLGTGGAVLNALDLVKEENLVILNADTYFPINLNKLFDFHTSGLANLSIALKLMEKFDRYGSVELNGNTVASFNEKKWCDKGLINGGIYAANKNFLLEKKFPEKFSFEKEILEMEAGTSNLKGAVFTDTFIDIGVPEDYNKAVDILNSF